MFCNKKAPQIIMFAMLMIFITSCQTLKLDPPGPDKQAVVVFPVTVTNNTERTSRHGFYYIYNVVNEIDEDITYKAVFKLPIKGDMLIVDSLPPGNYVVNQFMFKTVGTGDFTYGDNVFPRDDRFRLVAGKITIFSESLDVLLYNRIPGRGSSTTYSFNMNSVSRKQRDEVLATLEKLPNYSAWDVLGEKGTRAGSSGTSRQYSTFVVAENLRGGWSGFWRPITQADTEYCNEGKLSFDIDKKGSRLSGEGVDSAQTRYGISASLVDDGAIRGKLTLNRVSIAKVTGKLYDDGRILGSFDYGDDCMAEWKASLD